MMIYRLGWTLLPAVLLAVVPASLKAASCPDYLNHTLKKLHSKQEVNLCEAYAGKPMLIINTASFCGYTPQFKGLEQLHTDYRERGLVVLGFASDNFNQEAKTDREIADVCFVNYGVTFTMFAPIAVTGADAHPLFKGLAEQTAAPAWNFNKYLVDKQGNVVKHFSSQVKPDADEMKQAIDGVLSE